MAASDNWPMMDCSCLLVVETLSNHLPKDICRRSNFSRGSLISIFTESSSMPRKMRVVVGPTAFSGATGKPRPSQRWTAIWSEFLQWSGVIGGAEKEIVDIVDEMRNPLTHHGPGQSVRHGGE